MSGAVQAVERVAGGVAEATRSPGPALLRSKTLVLNRSFLPIHVTSVRRACVLLYRGVARAVDEKYQTFDFRNWCDLQPNARDAEVLGLVGRTLPVPRVILLSTYDRVPRRHVRFSRHNVYSRDRDTCQYCARRLPRVELNLDHVVPRSQGGVSSWENVVCSCHACNRRKGGRTPEQSGLRLIRLPTRPAWTPFLADAAARGRYPQWRPFLGLPETTEERAGAQPRVSDDARARVDSDRVSVG
jgi:5-methylcytosine-specific restriction endonuclease McrA